MPELISTKNRRRGFTLIELLIVVAIILILIAIALPNFLEAQVRAKVTKAMGEIRSLATAFEAYRTDWPVYPRGCLTAVIPSVGCSHNWGFVDQKLTTPIAYMTQVLDDLFAIHYDVLGVRGYYPEGHPIVKYRTTRRDIWNLESPNQFPVSPIPPDKANPSWVNVYELRNPGYWSGKQYLISSLGPDKNEDVLPSYAFDASYQVNAEFFSPTNGTNSSGDLVYAGP